MRADQVLVGLNRTRRLYNARIRELIGFRDPMPAAGEKLVCLRNDKTKGLLNGGTWTVQALRGRRRTARAHRRSSPEDERRRRPVEVVGAARRSSRAARTRSRFRARRESDEFTYGYALTVHKAQGRNGTTSCCSTKSYAFREHRSRWLYTAITRAAERVTVVT